VSALRQPQTTADDLAIGRPAGFALLADFVNEYDNGTIPATATTTKLREAFLATLKDAALDPAQVLRLTRRRGRPAQPASETERLYGPIWAFIVARLAKDSRRGALNRATEAASKKFHKTPRRIQEIWAIYAPLHKQMPRVRALAERHRTPKRKSVE
jgi:hypothetical protein